MDVMAISYCKINNALSRMVAVAPTKNELYSLRFKKTDGKIIVALCSQAHAVFLSGVRRAKVLLPSSLSHTSGRQKPTVHGSMLRDFPVLEVGKRHSCPFLRSTMFFLRIKD